MKRILLILTLLFSVHLAGPAKVEACPNCKFANESEADNRKPRAYMYSILFMLAMPAILFSSFGYGMYRLSKKQNESLPPLEEGDSQPST